MKLKQKLILAGVPEEEIKTVISTLPREYIDADNCIELLLLTHKCANSYLITKYWTDSQKINYTETVKKVLESIENVKTE